MNSTAGRTAYSFFQFRWWLGDLNAIDATKATAKTKSNARNTIATFLNLPAPFHIESEGRALKPPRRPYGRYHFLRHDTAGGKGRYGWSSHVAEAGSECPLMAKSGRSWGHVSRSACDPKAVVRAQSPESPVWDLIADQFDGQSPLHAVCRCSVLQNVSSSTS